MRKRQIEEDPKKAVFTKIAFLSVLLITAVLINYISATIPVKKVSDEPKKSVLGSQTSFDAKKFITNDSLGIKKKVDGIRDELQQKVLKLVNQKTEGVQASASALFFERAVDPILSQFKSLPLEQQDKVKAAICK